MFCIKTRMYRCESHTVLLLWLPESKPAPQCAAVALAWEGSRDPREDVKGCGYQSRKSCPPLTQPVLIALRKCSHLLFNPINPEIIVKVSGSSYGVFWNWNIVGARNIRWKSMCISSWVIYRAWKNAKEVRVRLTEDLTPPRVTVDRL